jgi:hypothetical protein
MSSEKHETSMLVLFFHSDCVSFPLTFSACTYNTAHSTNCMLAAAIYVDILEMQCKLASVFAPEVVVPRTCHSYVVTQEIINKQGMHA